MQVSIPLIVAAELVKRVGPYGLFMVTFCIQFNLSMQLEMDKPAIILTPQRTTPVSFSVIFDLIDSLIASFLLFFNQLQNITTTVDCRQPPRIDQSLTHFKTNCTYESKITRLHIFSYLVTI